MRDSQKLYAPDTPKLTPEEREGLYYRCYMDLDEIRTVMMKAMDAAAAILYLCPDVDRERAERTWLGVIREQLGTVVRGHGMDETLDDLFRLANPQDAEEEEDA